MSRFAPLFLLALLALSLSLATPPEVLTVKGSTLVPIRTIAKWLGATTRYDAKTTSTTITLGEHTVRIAPNSTAATVDGKNMTLTVAPCVKENTTYVPLRFIADAFGVKTKWDAKKKAATLTHPTNGKTLTLSTIPKKPLDIMPFFQAIASGDEASVTKQCTATPELLTSSAPDGESPAFVAAATGQMGILKLLIDKGVDLKAIIPAAADGGSFITGASLLHAAVMGGNEDILEFLTGKGLDVNGATSMGFTPLLIACGSDNKAAVTFLLEHGADIKAKASLPPEVLANPTVKEMSNKQGFGSPLMFAFGHADVEEILTKHGAQPLDAELVKELTAQREQGKLKACQNELRQIAMTAMIYAQQHENKLPATELFWKTLNLDKRMLQCPGKPEQDCGFGFNKQLGGMDIDTIGDPEKVIFAADAKTDIIGTADDIDRTRHGTGFCAVFCDGHAEFLKSDAEVKLIPAPAPPKTETPKLAPVKPTASDDAPPQATHHLVIQTAKGDIEVELYGKDAPKTVHNFVKPVGKHFYQGLTFHRVETSADFRLIQGGDPNGDGTGSSTPTVPLEISPKLRHVKGAIAMARTDDPDSASCQFYICINAIPQLDDHYAVFGKVTKGLDVVAKIVKGDKIKDIVLK